MRVSFYIFLLNTLVCAEWLLISFDWTPLVITIVSFLFTFVVFLGFCTILNFIDNRR